MRYLMMTALIVFSFATGAKAQVQAIVDTLAIKEISDHSVLLTSAISSFLSESEQAELRIHTDELAEFACGLYNRYAVALSTYTLVTGDNISATYTKHYLYACALQRP